MSWFNRGNLTKFEVAFFKKVIFTDLRQNYKFKSLRPNLLDFNHSYTYLNPCKSRICNHTLKWWILGGGDDCGPPGKNYLKIPQDN